MKIQYRIANLGEGWYAHVRFKGWLFWKRWQKIGMHSEGFGLYNLPNWNNALKTKQEAQDLIDKFDFWYSVNPRYIETYPLKLKPYEH